MKPGFSREPPGSELLHTRPFSARPDFFVARCFQGPPRVFKRIGQVVLWAFAVLKSIQELGWLDDIFLYVVRVAQIP